jgi:tRNA A-37 threonylcarbamoyl transferase component Bud32
MRHFTSLHGAGVYHGDVRPDNVTISDRQRTPGGGSAQLHIIDFSHAHADHKCPGPETCHELRLLKRLLSAPMTETASSG